MLNNALDNRCPLSYNGRTSTENTMKTIHDRLCHGLEAMGATKLPKRNKYTMFQLNRDGKASRYYFVGSSGALRASSRPSAATSIPCNDRFRQQVFDAPASELAEVGL
jgi:hypothetical protein